MIDGNDPAFPRTVQRWNESLEHVEGLTKREHIAIAAMQGLLASGDGAGLEPTEIASDAVNLADALLKRLAR